MPSPEQLQEENERLRAENEAYKAAAAKKEGGVLKKIILAVTTPKLWTGFALGIVISMLVYNIVIMEAALFVIKSILAVGAILAIGFFLGQWAVNKSQEQAVQAWKNATSNSKGKTANLISKLAQTITGKAIPPSHIEELSNAMEQHKPLLVSGRNWIIAVVLRVMAFSSLMGVLAIAVSFAVAIATFQQVGLLETQNDKLDKQNALLEQQDSLLVEQNNLFTEQNTKVSAQTDLMERQAGQIDTQNLYIVEQIRQASIQNRLVTAQNKRLDQQTNLQEAERRSALVFLFSNIMDAIDRELKDKNNTQRKLSKQLIGRIVALSASLKPYRYLTAGDTLTNQLLSPERGQLLINLVESDLDAVTYLNIFRKANFGYADLKDANLDSANLMAANLMAADLRYANLMAADLSGAILWDAILWDADLSDADLSDADLSAANLRDANLWGADLRNTRTNSLNFLTNLNQDITGNKELQQKYYVDTTLHKDIWGDYYLIKEKPTQQ